MIRGTTPTLSFVLPFEANTLKEAFVTVQYQSALETKTLEFSLGKKTLTADANRLSVKLTQEQTLEFQQGETVEVQLTVLTTDGTRMTTQIYKVSVDKILKEGVI